MILEDVGDDTCDQAPAGQESHDWRIQRDGRTADGAPYSRHVCRNCGLSARDVRERLALRRAEVRGAPLLGE